MFILTKLSCSLLLLVVSMHSSIEEVTLIFYHLENISRWYPLLVLTLRTFFSYSTLPTNVLFNLHKNFNSIEVWHNEKQCYLLSRCCHSSIQNLREKDKTKNIQQHPKHTSYIIDHHGQPKLSQLFLPLFMYFLLTFRSLFIYNV